MPTTIRPNASPYGTSLQGTVGNGPAGQVMPNVPLVQGSTGGWQPASTVSGLAANNAASAKSRAFALSNQPRLSDAAQQRYNALSQQRTTSGKYDDWLGSGGLNGNTGATGSVQSGVGGGSNAGDNIATARANLLNDTSVPLSAGERNEMGSHYTNLMRSMLGGGEADLLRDAAFQQAGLDYNRETGQANSGLGWANAGARFNEIGTGDAMAGQSSDLRRIGMLMEMLGLGA